MNKVIILNCNRCKHEWAAKKKDPKYCPKCKSPYWNKVRIRKLGGNKK